MYLIAAFEINVYIQSYLILHFPTINSSIGKGRRGSLTPDYNDKLIAVVIFIAHFFFQHDSAFLRNNQHRSTIQNGGVRSPPSNQYGGSGATTPTLRTTYIPPGLSRGSSHNSLNSTNPFDDDYGDTVSQVGSMDGVSIRRSGRKKRRAPAPPSSPSSTVRDRFYAHPFIWNMIWFFKCVRVVFFSEVKLQLQYELLILFFCTAT